MSTVERLTGVDLRRQGPILLAGLGHGATHWVAALFYLFLPYISGELGLSYAEAGLLVAVFHLSSASANLFSGPLVDITGRHVAIQVASLSVGAGALAAFAGAGGVLALAGLVLLIGASNNVWHPAAISFLSSRHPENRGYALSVHALGANVGDTVAPLAGGLLLLWLGWRESAAVGALPIFAVAAWLAISLSGLESASGSGAAARRGMSGREYLTGLGRVVRDRTVLCLCFMAGFRSMAQVGLLTFLPLYLVNVLDAGPLLLGIGLSALQIGGVIAAPIAGTWSDRIGRRPIVFAGLGSSTAVILGLTFVGHELAFVVGVSLLGFVLFAIRPVVHSWLMDLTPPSLGGSATSLMFGTQAALGALAPLLGGLIADRLGLGAVFYLLAACLLVANLLVLPLPRGGRAATT